MSDLATYVDGRQIGLDLLDTYHLQLELVYQELVAAELLDEPVSIPLECVWGALALVRDALESDTLDFQATVHLQCTKEQVEGQGLTFPGTCWHAYWRYDLQYLR